MKKIFATICVGLVMISGVAQAKIYSTRVPQATAECGDGKFSDSTGRGTCSGHGGVKRWLSRLETTADNNTDMAAPMNDTNYPSSPGASQQVTETTTYETQTLPNTGGEPLLMMALGSLVSGSAFFFRRKI